MKKLLQTYNNGIEAWEIGSKTIIPYLILKKINEKEIELVDGNDCIKIKINDKIIEKGNYIILQNDKIITLSKKEFNDKYFKDYTN